MKTDGHQWQSHRHCHTAASLSWCQLNYCPFDLHREHSAVRMDKWYSSFIYAVQTNKRTFSHHLLNFRKKSWEVKFVESYCSQYIFIPHFASVTDDCYSLTNGTMFYSRLLFIINLLRTYISSAKSYTNFKNSFLDKGIKQLSSSLTWLNNCACIASKVF